MIIPWKALSGQGDYGRLKNTGGFLDSTDYKENFDHNELPAELQEWLANDGISGTTGYQQNFGNEELPADFRDRWATREIRVLQSINRISAVINYQRNLGYNGLSTEPLIPWATSGTLGTMGCQRKLGCYRLPAELWALRVTSGTSATRSYWWPFGHGKLPSEKQTRALPSRFWVIQATRGLRIIQATSGLFEIPWNINGTSGTTSYHWCFGQDDHYR